MAGQGLGFTGFGVSGEKNETNKRGNEGGKRELGFGGKIEPRN